jgi:hypothetical protein
MARRCHTAITCQTRDFTGYPRVKERSLPQKRVDTVHGFAQPLLLVPARGSLNSFVLNIHGQD